ncbi:MAG: 4-hydroxythreonine-4-phosphate dehydrogenase PdxA [Candidatus Omnitrophota bacterium]
MPTSTLKNRLLPKIGITIGDPSGIGPEVVAKALSQDYIARSAKFTVIGDSFVFRELGRYKNMLSRFGFIDLANIQREFFCFGKTNAKNGLASLEYIDESLLLFKKGALDGLVTGPVQKESIIKTGLHFSGHTEYLAQKTKTKNFAMMFVTSGLKVVLLTRHLPLKEVSKALTKRNIYNTVKLTVLALKNNFGVSFPRLAVCGLNPHAGEGGYLGREEIDKIIPAFEKIKKEFDCTIYGPAASDTLFYLAKKNKFDVVIAMYHDQGLIPLKLTDPRHAVNLTLGLPFIRTSPAHGTGLNIAGKNCADATSMVEAIKLAVRLCRKSG